MFKDILTFIGLDYRDASLITFYFVVLGIGIQKSNNQIIISYKNLLLKKVKNRHVKIYVWSF